MIKREKRKRDFDIFLENGGLETSGNQIDLKEDVVGAILAWYTILFIPLGVLCVAMLVKELFGLLVQ